MFILEFISRWSMFMIIGLSFVPYKVWDREKGRYRGFFQRDLMAWMPLLLLGGGVFSWSRGETGTELLTTVAVGCLLLYILPRICVEIRHKSRHGVWLGFPARRGDHEVGGSSQ